MNDTASRAVSGTASSTASGISLLQAFEAFDQLATMVVMVRPDGRCLQANSALENTVGMSRRSLQRGSIFDWLPSHGR